MSRPPNTESVFRALGHPIRRRVVELLARGERTAGELMDAGAIQRPTLSEHLRTLCATNVIAYRRRGNRLVYNLNRTGLSQAADWIARALKSK